MSLTGKAKTDYQREYMRKRRSNKPALDPIVRPKLHQQLERQGLVMAGNKIVGVTKVTPDPVQPIPRYNAALHKAGDRVLVLKGKRWVEAVIPELDAGGQPYY